MTEENLARLTITDAEIEELKASVKKSVGQTIRESFVIQGYRPVDESVEFSHDCSFQDYCTNRQAGKVPTHIVNGFTPIEDQPLSKFIP